MPTRSTKFQEQIKSKILLCLENRPMTMAEIANEQRLNYHTVRKWVNVLKDEGYIRQVFNGNARDIKYTLGEDTNANGIIPIITTPTGKSKAHVLMTMMHTNAPDTLAGKAISNLPQHIMRLMRAAERIYKDSVNLDHSIEMVRKDMLADREALSNFIDVYDQVLNNPKYWDPKLLSRFPLDAQWDESLLKSAIKHYFKE